MFSLSLYVSLKAERFFGQVRDGACSSEWHRLDSSGSEGLNEPSIEFCLFLCFLFVFCGVFFFGDVVILPRGDLFMVRPCPVGFHASRVSDFLARPLRC